MAETVAALLADLAAMGIGVNHLWLADEGVTVAGGRCTQANDLSGSAVATPLVAVGPGCKYDATKKSWMQDDVGASPFGFLRSAISPALNFGRTGGFTVGMISTAQSSGVYAAIGDNTTTPAYPGQTSVIGQPAGFAGAVFSGDQPSALSVLAYSAPTTLQGTTGAPADSIFAPIAGELRAWGAAFDKTNGRVFLDEMGDWMSDIQWSGSHSASFVFNAGGTAYPTAPSGSNRFSLLPKSAFGTQQIQAVIVLDGVPNAVTNRRFWWRWQQFAEGRFSAKSFKTRPKIIVPGDSVTAIALASDGSDAPTPYAWTERIQALHPEWDVFSQGVGGWTWYRMLDDSAFGTPFDLPHQTIPFLNPNRGLVVIAAFEFANMYNNANGSAPSTAQTIYDATQAYFAAAKSQATAIGAAANLKLLLLTSPSNNVSAGVETVWQKRADTRTLYLAGHSWVDGFIDTIGGPTTTLGANAAAASTTLFIDGTHLTHAGKVQAGNDVEPALAALVSTWMAGGSTGGGGTGGGVGTVYPGSVQLTGGTPRDSDGNALSEAGRTVTYTITQGASAVQVSASGVLSAKPGVTVDTTCKVKKTVDNVDSPELTFTVRAAGT